MVWFTALSKMMKGWVDAMMRRRHSSTRRYAHNEDLEPEVRRSGAMDRRADGAVMRTLQPPL